MTLCLLLFFLILIPEPFHAQWVTSIPEMTIDCQVQDDSIQLSLADRLQLYASQGAAIVCFENAIQSATLENLSYALLVAAQEQRNEIAQFLLTHGANVSIADPVFAFTSLHYAAMQGNVDLLNILLRYNASIDAISAVQERTDGITPLHVAVAYNKPEIVILLLQHGANIEAKSNPSRNTPLHVAAMTSNLEAARILIDAGANVSSLNLNNATPLHFAGDASSPQIVQLLLLRGAGIDAKDLNGNTALLNAVLSNSNNNSDNSIATVKRLIPFGANVHDVYLSLDNSSILHLASNPDIVSALIVAGASVHTRDKFNNTPLHKAAYLHSAEVAKVLLDHQAEVNAVNVEMYGPLHYAIARNNSAVAKLLISRGANSNAKNSDGNTALHLLPFTDDVDIVIAALNAGGDVNARNNEEQTPLHLAASNGRVSMMRLLIAYGANMEAQDMNGNTPMHYAVDYANNFSNLYAAKTLLELGANLYAKNNQGVAAIDQIRFEARQQLLMLDQQVKGLSPSPDNNAVLSGQRTVEYYMKDLQSIFKRTYYQLSGIKL